MIISLGSSEKYFAAIGVTYPEGSTCTCTNNEKTMKATDTSGKYIFSIPKAGTWVVSCTNGEKTKSLEIVIDTEGQAVNLKMAYEVYYYSKGNECEDITGGWNKVKWHKYGTGALTKNEDSIQINANGSYSGSNTNAAGVAAITANKIDISNIDTLYLNVTSLTTSTTARDALFGLIDTNAGGTNQYVAAEDITGKGPGLYSLDISSFSGEYYVFVSVYHSGGNGISSFPMTFNEVYGA